MKPRTKFHKKVALVRQGLKPATEKQINWGIGHVFQRSGFINKLSLWCLECGHQWKVKGNLMPVLAGCTCPGCDRELKISQSRKRKHEEAAYFTICSKVKEFQVIRTFYLTRFCARNNAARVACTEVMQHWIDGKGNFCLYSKMVNGMSYYYDLWIKNSDMELRDYTTRGAILRSEIVPNAIYAKGSFLPEIKRNGFTGDFHGHSPFVFLRRLLIDSKMETLLKSGQHKMLRYYLGRGASSVDKYWNSIKICIRNGYTIPSASMWVDYIELLAHFNKDLLSSHYVCPVDLKISHDTLVRKKREAFERARIAEMREKTEIAQIEYQKQKGAFFGLAFTNGQITVKVLETVQDFMLEGDRLKHCVFASEYYKRPDSLVLSARIGDEPIETIELSLSNLKILQARGWDNKPTEYHSEIINLVDSNLHAINAILTKSQP
ncbi:PcfJ-like protein [Dyadobacter soli]|uniref:PcfJ-like protein n=1 Tax=Dyadobacter soli TaxID=659014 RepID=A0A1G7WK94_9BACT|nr:PcfJ domain-containing protein [Dyadobacter soli]SDG72415.1 PcfJ-like protein [Dyadobacter soli]